MKVTNISDDTYAYASTSYFDYKADEDNTGEGDGTLDVPEITYTNDNTVTYDGDIIYLEGDAGSAKVIIATYTANNVLIKADMVDYKMAFGEFGQQQIYNHTEAVTGNTVKAFIWKGIGDITPLAISKLQTIPSLESTEDVTE